MGCDVERPGILQVKKFRGTFLHGKAVNSPSMLHPPVKVLLILRSATFFRIFVFAFFSPRKSTEIKTPAVAVTSSQDAFSYLRTMAGTAKHVSRSSVAASGDSAKQSVTANKACIPCRMRKVKCDAAVIGFPCSSCTSRQCAADCAMQKRKVRKAEKGRRR